MSSPGREDTRVAKALISGHRVLLFISNPQVPGPYPDPTGFGPAYDVLTAPEPTGYSVPSNAKSVEDGDVAVIYRVDAGAQMRDPGQIVAIARITSSPWYTRHGYTDVNWQLQLLPPKAWIKSADMKKSGLWTNKVPLSMNKQALSPVQLDTQQWSWLARRLPPTAVGWLEAHTRDQPAP